MLKLLWQFCPRLEDLFFRLVEVVEVVFLLSGGRVGRIFTRGMCWRACPRPGEGGAGAGPATCARHTGETLMQPFYKFHSLSSVNIGERTGEVCFVEDPAGVWELGGGAGELGEGRGAGRKVSVRGIITLRRSLSPPPSPPPPLQLLRSLPTLPPSLTTLLSSLPHNKLSHYTCLSFPLLQADAMMDFLR